MNMIFWQNRKIAKSSLNFLTKNFEAPSSAAKFFAFAACASITMLAAMPATAAENDVAAKIAKVSKLITNEQGAIRYIVLLDDGRKVDTEKPAPRTINKAEVESAVEGIKRATDALVADVIRPAGAKSLRTTALIAPTFLAYLDEKQVKQLASDKRLLLEQDTYVETSNLWNDTNSGAQVNSWGVEAMGLSNPSPSNGLARVFVLDTGIVPHADLPQFSPGNEWRAMPGITQSPCWDHATHVAGIIGAANNEAGTVGMLPGVSITSMNVNDVVVTNSFPNCSTIGSLSNIVSALDAIRYINLFIPSVSIVNISLNYQNSFGANTIIGTAMASLATPTWHILQVISIGGFPYLIAVYVLGSLVVQSAGNFNQNACNFAYNNPDANDGIIVVGALDENGNRMRPLLPPSTVNGVPMPESSGFETAVTLGPYAAGGGVTRQAGSNHNDDGPSCVELWAPGQRIRSLWRDNGTEVLSGTSMAAPHVVGLAARLLESNPTALDTPAKLEQAVRQQLITIGGSNVSMPRFGGPVNAAASIDVQVVITNPDTRPGQPPRIWARASHGASSFSGSLGANPNAPLNLTVGAFGASYCDYNIIDSNNIAVMLSQSLGSLSSNKVFFASDFGLSAPTPAQTVRTLAVYCRSPTNYITSTVATGIVLQ